MHPEVIDAWLRLIYSKELLSSNIFMYVNKCRRVLTAIVCTASIVNVQCACHSSRLVLTKMCYVKSSTKL